MMDLFRRNVKKILFNFGLYKKPDFIIIGAQKAGSTFLYSVLSQHSNVIRPNFKEAHFFDRDENYHKGINSYYLNFPIFYKYSKQDITFEATPDYLFYPKCAERIRKDLGEIKMIIVLRDPVERAFSSWNMHHNLFSRKDKYKDLVDKRSFEDAIKEELARGLDYLDIYSYVFKGVYVNQIRNFLKYHSRENLLIIENEDLKNDFQNTLNLITDFLGLKKLKVETLNKNDSLFWDNKSEYLSKPSPDISRTLQEFYYPYNKELEEFLGKKFKWME
jgi:hypothetical protein